jgi:hypothetical protein
MTGQRNSASTDADRSFTAIPPETLSGERGRQTAMNIGLLAAKRITVDQLNSNYVVGPAGSITVRFDDETCRLLSNPGGSHI